MLNITICQIESVVSLRHGLRQSSYNNADQPSVRVVDDPFHRILQLHLAFLADGGNLRLNPLFYHLVH